ncbi:MAG: ThuA domain-containing protein [Candidatus Solibacter usitatus]|nr:ThuA domain-containing protein [Candidatus Solibacter usitatus]
MLPFLLALGLSAAPGAGIVFEGGKGPGRGKHIVLVSGDEEYRSEEALPQLAKILSTRHGFKCTVLFAIDKADGAINPNQADNIPGLEALAKAGLMVIFTRFRDLPDEQMKHIVDYVNSGRPIVGMRTATHAFNFKLHQTYAAWSWNSKEWDGGFGRQVLGETWIRHHGKHAVQGTRGIIAPGQEAHPILRGIASGALWVPTDVYAAKLPLPGDSLPLLLGQVTDGMTPDSAPAAGPQNEPMMPVAWTRTYTGSAGKAARVFTTSMGSSQDLSDACFRRLMVNGVYWALGMEKAIQPGSSVDLVGEYRPSPFKFNGHVKGVKPEDLTAR